MARHNREAKKLVGNAMPSMMENRSKLGGIHTTNVLILLSVPLLAVFALYLGRQQPLLPLLRSYLPGQLHVHLPARLWEVTTAVNPDTTLSTGDLLKACGRHQYTTEIVSLDPLLIYINNFTSAQEAEELIKLGSPEFAESFISRSRGSTQRVTGRTSQSAPLSMNDPLVACLLSRARKFMGSMLLPSEPFSIPQLVRYFSSQKYDLHTDFWPEHQIVSLENKKQVYFNRIASFFVFLRDNCTEGYTYFPLVEPLSPITLDRMYNGKIAQGEMDGDAKGIKFKPMRGNAVFWVNLDKDGKGDRRVVHAGLPVIQGEKIGLNIWPMKYFGFVHDGDEDRDGTATREGWSGRWKD